MTRAIVFIFFFLLWGHISFCQHNLSSPWDVRTEDSVVRHDRGFRYMTNLDSVLRVLNREADSLNRLNRNDISSQKKNRPSAILNLFNNDVFKLIFWIVLGLFFLYIVYKLFSFDLFARRKEGSTNFEDIQSNDLQQSSWYHQEILRAEEAGEYKLAVRFRFMNLLSVLNENHLIEYSPDKMNSTYVSEISVNDLKTHFAHLASVYEYVWYGKNSLTLEQYNRLKIVFEETKNSANGR